MSRATNCTTPGYLVVMIIARNSCDSKFFPVCSHLCGQSRFLARFPGQAKSRKCPCCKGFRALAVPIVDRRKTAPKAGALPTALHPVIQFFIRLGVFSQIKRDTTFATPGYLLVTIIARNSCDSKFFPVCGHLCGQSRFLARFPGQAKSRKRPCCKGFRALAVPIVDRRGNAPKAGALPTALHPVIMLFHPAGRILPKQARYQLRYTRLFSFLSGWADSPKPLGEKGCDGNRDRKFLIFLRNPPDQKTRKTVESIGKSCLVQFISVGII